MYLGLGLKIGPQQPILRTAHIISMLSDAEVEQKTSLYSNIPGIYSVIAFGCAFGFADKPRNCQFFIPFI